MTAMPPGLAWSIFFAVLYLVLMIRFGRLAMHTRNPLARSALTWWTAVAYLPLSFIAVKPTVAGELAPVIVWTRQWILLVLASIVMFGHALLVVSRRRDIAALLRALESQADASARHEWAARLELYGLYGRAMAAHRRTIAAAPEFAPAYVHLAALLGMRGEFDEAEALCRRAVELAPQSGDGHFYLGMALMEREAIQAAARECEIAMECGLTKPQIDRARQIIERAEAAK